MTLSFFFFFFFQAEDGIRDYKVTGVQTCALPICRFSRGASRAKWLRDAPIQQASRNHVRMVWDRSRPWACGLFAQPAIQDWTVGVDAAVAEKGPVAPRVFAFCGVAFDDEDFFFVIRRFGGDLSEGIGDKRISPEFKTGVAG